MRTEHRFEVSAISLITSLVLVGCGTIMHLPSHWPDKPVVVDGKNTEWDRTYLIDDNKLVISFVNDSSFAYLIFATNDRPLAMSMMRGFTVWFDAKGGDDKTFGIHYPMGGRFARESQSGGKEIDELSLEPAEQIGMPITELEILGPGRNDRHRMQIMETGGIQAKYTVTVNSFVYELKVPFTQGDQYPFAIRSKVGDVIGLGLESSEGRIQRGDQDSGERDTGTEPAEGAGEDAYGGQGMREAGRGGRGGFSQGAPRASQGTLELWMKVKLVTKDTLAS